MSITMPEVAETRATMIRAYRDGLMSLVEDATQSPGEVRDPDTGELEMNLGDWDGVPVVTRRRLDDAIRAIFGQPIPAPSETTVEVSTPATIYVSAVCPRCDIAQLISMTVHPELLIDDEGSELRVKAKAKGRSHVCGQLPLETSADAEGGLEQIGFLETIESLVGRVYDMLTDPLMGDLDQAPSVEMVASWDRATIDQVDRWVTSYLASAGDHPETCSAQFAADGTTGERICDCGLAAAVPPLPRVLGGEADPEPVDETASDVDFGEGAPNIVDNAGAFCPYPGCDLVEDHEGDHHVPPEEDEGDDALLPA